MDGPGPVISSHRLPLYFTALVLALATSAVWAHPSYAADLATTYCGVVKAYQPSASAAPPAGSVTIGAQSIPLAFGSSASISVGSTICLTGTYNARGVLTNYSSVPMPASYCGRVSEFVAPTASTNGHVALSTSTAIATFKIPAGASITAADAQGDRCAALVTDSLGDAIVRSLSASSPSAQPSTASALPSTATSSPPSDLPLVPLAAIGLVVAITAGVLWRLAARRV